MTVAKRLSKIRNPLCLIIQAKLNAVKEVCIDNHYVKSIFIDGSYLEIRYYHYELLTKVTNWKQQ